jgi:prepilin-type N-terminal cleavage/methylation domain-containing protein
MRAFTLIELVIVMLLLGIVTALAIPHMASFFRARVLNSEARQVLALIHFGQSRAVAEGVPVVFWVDPKQSTFGIMNQTGAARTTDWASSFPLDSALTIDAFAPDPPPVSEDGDERLGVPDGLKAIRFMPDGFYDDASVVRIVIRQGAEGAVEIAQTANRLGYEIKDATPN